MVLTALSLLSLRTSSLARLASRSSRVLVGDKRSFGRVEGSSYSVRYSGRKDDRLRLIPGKTVFVTQDGRNKDKFLTVVLRVWSSTLRRTPDRKETKDVTRLWVVPGTHTGVTERSDGEEGSDC